MEPTSRDVLTITSTARPKRVAFLVDPRTLKLEELDSVTKRCSSYWGGGFWPIVPTDGHDVAEDWWRVLEAADPDVVYALSALSAELFDRIHRQLAPAVFVNAEPAERARRGGHLWVDHSAIEALEAHQLVAYHAQRQRYLPAVRFLYLTDSAQPAPDRSFILRNFGLLDATIATRIAFESVEHDNVAVHETSKSDLLKLFLDFHGQLVAPRDLSRLYVPRPYDLAYSDFARGFHLLVGDSVDDILFTWNRALASEGHAGRDVLWLDGASARDPEFVRLVGEWIKRVFWNEQQQQRGKVVSYSEDIELLRSVAAVIQEVAWLGCDPVRLERGQFPFATRSEFAGLRYPSPFEQVPRRTEQIPVLENGGLLGVPRPPFTSSTSGQGGWMVDLDVEYRLDPPRYVNRSDSWRLPRRALLGHLFSSGIRHARIVASGLPSVSVSPGEESIPLRVPSKRELLAYLLEPLPSSGDTAEAARQFPRSRFRDFRTSEQGRRFRGMIDLFGGVDSAGRAFEDPFWRAVFLEGAGKPSNDVERRAEIVKRKLRAAECITSPATIAGKGSGSQASGVGNYDALARQIVTSLHRAEPRLKTFTRKQLRDMFGRLRGQEKIATDKGQRRMRFDDDAEYVLEWLLDARVLLQGVTLTCPTCGIEQWRIVDDLASVVRCEGCTAHFALPPEPEWRFRLNGLVQSALARDAVLPLLHAVYDLCSGAHEMALVIAPQELRETYDGPVVTDLDIVLVRDGRFIIGEVKSRPDAFDEATLATLGDVARSIRPDVLILAGTGSAWPHDVRERVERLRTALRAADVELSERLLEW